MKKMNLLVMSLVSAAALSFSSCSSNDDLGGGAGTQSQVKGFYMTLAVQTPTSNETRTAQSNETAATPAESDVTSGTLYLVDAKGEVAFSKTISAAEWEASKIPTQGQAGKTQIQIQVEKVAAGATYKVYFLANTTDAKPWENILTATSKFAEPFVTNKAFAMFNQNDATVDGNGYTVVFKDENKEIKTPAEVKYKNATSPIKIERIAARIDEPNSIGNKIVGYVGTNATDAEKRAMADALAKVEGLQLTRYAISNLADKSYIMQKWADETTLTIPSGITYWHPAAEFGSKTKFENADRFTAATATAAFANKDYVFENNSSTSPSTMYFEYKVTLKDMTNADFSDGTFYRYNNVIYKSFADIFAAYKDVAGLFKGQTAAKLVEELTKAKKVETVEGAKDVETKLADFRAKYDIEVFNEGKTYYKQVIQDQYLKKDDQLIPNVIQRNSIYQLTVNNIFNIGAQVPNGEIDKTALFYLDVTVSVNPWVLNSQDVNLGE
ncbi:Mfa1 family fimbria major subunit [Segatella copri]|uniref:Mfa1 family fimbria major subunit n=1 Tax=Segatella copri TaxID=165179 RepID=UPI003CFEE2D4